MTDEIRRTLELFHAPDEMVEIRYLNNDGKAKTILFKMSDIETKVKEIERIDADINTRGIYHVLNRLNDAISKSAEDKDVVEIRWLKVDIDWERPPGESKTNATDEEKAKNKEKIERIKELLHSFGFPEPVEADSGNGSHALYRVSLKPEDKTLVEAFLKTLDTLFPQTDTDKSHVDISVFNPARIWKLYGTIARKGINSKPRPWRRSVLTRVPDAIQPVSREMLISFIEKYKKPTEQPQTTRLNTPVMVGASTLDLKEWISKHPKFAEMYHPAEKRPKSYQRYLYHVSHCPNGHTDGVLLQQLTGGAISFKCQHNSCGGTKNYWQDIRAEFDQQYADAKQKTDDKPLTPYDVYEKERGEGIFYKHQKKPPTGVEETHFVRKVAIAMILDEEEDNGIIDAISRKTLTLKFDEISSIITQTREEILNVWKEYNAKKTAWMIDEDVEEEAMRILTEGDPVAYIMEQYHSNHIKDEELGLFLLACVGCQSVENVSDGLHPSPYGLSGTGKSDACRAMYHLIPEEYTYRGSISPKFLYYANLKEGSIVFIDDVEALDDAMMEFLKTSITFYTTGNSRGIPIKDGDIMTGKMLTSPPRLSFWITSQDANFDTQILNRFIKLIPDDSETTDNLVYEDYNRRAVEGKKKYPITKEVKVCREMIRQIKQAGLVSVKNPIMKDIEWNAKGNRRLFPQFTEMVASFTIIYRFQRQTDTDGKLVSTEIDFRHAEKVLKKFSKEQLSKLNRDEQIVYDYMKQHIGCIVWVAEIINDTGLSIDRVSRAINGRQKNGNRVGGLKQKTPYFHEELDVDTHKKFYRLTKDNLGAFEAYGSIVKLSEKKSPPIS